MFSRLTVWQHRAPRRRLCNNANAILGSGVALAFLGHGVLGAKGEEKFVALVTGNYDKLAGTQPPNGLLVSRCE